MAGPEGRIPPGPSSAAREPVSRILFYAVIPLGAALPRTLISDLPGGFDNCSNRLAASGRCAAPAWLLALPVSGGASLPIWSCSVWGLPCRRHYCRRGALLPHLFTLTGNWPFRQSPFGPVVRAEARTGCPRSPIGVPSDRSSSLEWPETGDNSIPAVCFLWHSPSTGLYARVPDVIRHTALRSSDFPLP